MGMMTGAVQAWLEGRRRRMVPSRKRVWEKKHREFR